MRVSLGPGTARRIIICSGIVVVLVAAYAVFGFVGVPALIRSQGTAFVMHKYQRTLQLGEIHFNPFTLELLVQAYYQTNQSDKLAQAEGRLRGTNVPTMEQALVVPAARLRRPEM